jgi:hypothetical protein
VRFPTSITTAGLITDTATATSYRPMLLLRIDRSASLPPSAATLKSDVTWHGNKNRCVFLRLFELRDNFVGKSPQRGHDCFVREIPNVEDSHEMAGSDLCHLLI